MGGCALPESQQWEDSLELIALELRLPLNVLQQSAEELAQQLRDTDGDSPEVRAAEALIHSTERMRRLVQALGAFSRDVLF